MLCYKRSCVPCYLFSRCCVTGYPVFCATWRTEEIQHVVLQEIQCTVLPVLLCYQHAVLQEIWCTMLCVFQVLCYKISSVLLPGGLRRSSMLCCKRSGVLCYVSSR